MIRLSTMFFVLLLSACAQVPSEIAVQENTNLVPYSEVTKRVGDSSKAGEKARWGGKIANVENKQDVSVIEIVFFPEATNGKPRVNAESPGRFKAIVDGFVDPMVFEKGRLITVVGNVANTSAGLIGEQEYIYPTLDAEGYFMWRKTSELELQTVGFTPFAHGVHYHRSFFNPWYDPWWAHNQRTRVRVLHRDKPSQGSRNQGQSNSNRKKNIDPPLISEPKPLKPGQSIK